MQGPLCQQSVDNRVRVGRRKAARLRLALPAKLTTTPSSFSCILRDLSQSGARVRLVNPLPVGEACLLTFCDRELFVFVVRQGTSSNGLEFEHPISKEDVLDVRAYAEDMEAVGRRQLLTGAREWVEGLR